MSRSPFLGGKEAADGRGEPVRSMRGSAPTQSRPSLRPLAPVLASLATFWAVSAALIAAHLI